ncbi:MAG: glycosyltransferase N-terminal domain-containing protein, partial [Pyrinomonadaceae bacterium]
PRHVAKTGALLLAKKTGQPVLPFSVNSARHYEVPSWDRFQIPAPFSRALVRIAPPIYVPSDADEQTLEARRDELQRSLDRISR